MNKNIKNLNLSNCEKCGRLHIKKLDNICSACAKIRYVETEQIKGWISSSKNPRLANIEEEINISIDNFKEYLQEGRIKTYNRVKGNCERCNIEITIKTRNILCQNCQNILKNPRIENHSFHSKE